MRKAIEVKEVFCFYKGNWVTDVHGNEYRLSGHYYEHKVREDFPVGSIVVIEKGKRVWKLVRA